MSSLFIGFGVGTSPPTLVTAPEGLFWDKPQVKRGDNPATLVLLNVPCGRRQNATFYP